MSTLALLLNTPLFFLYLIFIALGFWLGYHFWGNDARRLERVRDKNDDLSREVAARQADSAKR